MNKITLAIAAATAALLAGAPADAACMLKPFGNLPLTITSDGALTVPLKIAGKDHAMALELSVPESAISDSAARALNLTPEKLPRNSALNYRGVIVKQQVFLPAIQLGAMPGNGLAILLLPSGAPLPQGAVGVLGSVLVSNADLEIDFAANTAKLFSPDHCEGGAVYWADTAGTVPFSINNGGRLAFAAELDGKPLTVSFGAENRLTTAASQRLLAGQSTFKMLKIGDVTLNNPQIRVGDNALDIACRASAKPVACFGRTDMELNLASLRGLHLYFAFGEKKIYVTAADAHK